HSLMYQQYICDGDSKTILSIVEKLHYGDNVTIEKNRVLWACLKVIGQPLEEMESLVEEKEAV
ncbi:hypothetical protein NPIL_161151, partial [Nephila pilipes]